MGRSCGADVLIVGGGPAGAAAAIGCRRAGLSVRVVVRIGSRGAQPGEALHPGAEPLLHGLGVDAAVRAAGFLRHRGHWVTWGDTTRFESFGSDDDGSWCGFQAWRATFDRILLDAAERTGADVTPGVATLPLVKSGRVVGAVVDGERVPARFVIDAAGSRHWLARRLGLPRVTASPRLIAWYAYGTSGSDRNECPSITADGDGWTWRARVRRDVEQWVRLPLVPGRPSPPRDFPRDRTPIRGADVTWRHVPASAGAGYVLAGDAALTVDPLSSHGVLRALLSGSAAAALIARTLEGSLTLPDAARNYRAWQAAWFTRETAALRRLYATMPCPPTWASL